MSGLLPYDPNKVQVIFKVANTQQQVYGLADVVLSEDIGRNIMVWNPKDKNFILVKAESLEES